MGGTPFITWCAILDGGCFLHEFQFWVGPAQRMSIKILTYSILVETICFCFVDFHLAAQIANLTVQMVANHW